MNKKNVTPEDGTWKPKHVVKLTHFGPETRILVFGVFSLQLWKTDDANLPFNTRVDFTHLITQKIKKKFQVEERGYLKKTWLYFELMACY
jgi:hypothetical protein